MQMTVVNYIICVLWSFSSCVRQERPRNGARLSSAARNDERSAAARSSRRLGLAWLGLFRCRWVVKCVLRVSCRHLCFSLCVTIALWGFKTHCEWFFLVWFVRVNFGRFKRVCGRGGKIRRKQAQVKDTVTTL